MEDAWGLPALRVTYKDDPDNPKAIDFLQHARGTARSHRRPPHLGAADSRDDRVPALDGDLPHGQRGQKLGHQHRPPRILHVAIGVYYLSPEAILGDRSHGRHGWWRRGSRRARRLSNGTRRRGLQHCRPRHKHNPNRGKCNEKGSLLAHSGLLPATKCTHIVSLGVVHAKE